MAQVSAEMLPFPRCLVSWLTPLLFSFHGLLLFSFYGLFWLSGRVLNGILSVRLFDEFEGFEPGDCLDADWIVFAIAYDCLGYFAVEA